MTATSPSDDGEESESDADVAIRRVERADLLAVVRIENASFPQPWPYEAFEAFLDGPGFLVAAAGDDLDRVVGYVVADVTPNHGRGLGHVKDVAVHPERRGEGIGSTLLERALATMAAEGASSVKLEVREDNEGAKRLYRAFGFEPLRRIPRYYDDGEDAIVMVRDLS